MPLTIDHIRTFYDNEHLEEMLSDLVTKRYLKMEYPKKKVENRRVQDTTLPLGYNIVAGKMSYEISKILDPNCVAPTLVAMDMHRLFVGDGDGLRTLSLREGLRLFGYPDDFCFDTALEDGYDLLGNTVVVPVIEAVATRLLKVYYGGTD
ncbi:MAG: cytosine methyltransferase [Clostridiales bacterium]|nr:cytosine methyltransferase [Clostridiales bacterium]